MNFSRMPKFLTYQAGLTTRPERKQRVHTWIYFT